MQHAHYGELWLTSQPANKAKPLEATWGPIASPITAPADPALKPDTCWGFFLKGVEGNPEWFPAAP